MKDVANITLAMTMGCIFAWISASYASDPTDLTNGVSDVVANGVPGPVYPENTMWWPIVGGDNDTTFPSLIVMAREYGNGRVIADTQVIGTQPGLLDNAVLDQNCLLWLLESSTKPLAYTTGHGEWLTPSLNLKNTASELGLEMHAIDAPITAAELDQYGVLIVSMAPETISESEIDTIEQWVLSGGGLLLKGLGWAWLAYHPDQTMDDYPMTKLGSRFGARWLPDYIYDPTHQYKGMNVFHTFYPDLDSPSASDASARIEQMHNSIGPDLPSILETSDFARQRFMQAHSALAIPSKEYLDVHPLRSETFDAYSLFVESWPEFYSRGFSYDVSTFSNAAWARERSWLTWRDSLPLNVTRRTFIANAGQLDETRRTLFMRHDLILLDNDLMGTPEVQHILDMLDLIPADLVQLNSISATDCLGDNTSSISLRGNGNGVNIFCLMLGQATGNPFPTDVPPYVSDGFIEVLSHEVNHVVHTGELSDSWNARKEQLIEAAGEDSMNYLRSMIPDGYFVNAPQEFFASIANQWFALSERSMELGLVRFDNGRIEPINQALFFLDTYSQGTNVSWYYESNSTGIILRTSVLLERDSSGNIVSLDHQGTRIEFAVDDDGNVTSYTQIDAPAGACCLADQCFFVQEASCITTSGLYLGDDVSCSDDCESVCPGDFTDSGYVDVEDLLLVISNWQNPYTVDDLLLVISQWNNTCP